MRLDVKVELAISLGWGPGKGTGDHSPARDACRGVDPLTHGLEANSSDEATRPRMKISST